MIAKIRQSISSAWPARPCSAVSWSMSPPGTPVASTSAASARRAASIGSTASPPRSARASTSATANAELDDKPEPAGTVDETSRSAPGIRRAPRPRGCAPRRRRTCPTPARPHAGRRCRRPRRPRPRGAGATRARRSRRRRATPRPRTPGRSPPAGRIRRCSQCGRPSGSRDPVRAEAAALGHHLPDSRLPIGARPWSILVA